MSANTVSAEAFALKGRRVFVAGHRGMVGSAIVRRLGSEGCQILTAGRGEVDLRRQQPVEDWIRAQRPDVVIVAAATVGGILANATRPAIEVSLAPRWDSSSGSCPSSARRTIHLATGSPIRRRSAMKMSPRMNG